MNGRFRVFLLFSLSLAFFCGCISQTRTPYHEISLTEESGRDLDFFWPLYMGDGRAHYALWPLIKKSPGCFAALPFYNYDHGIHDIGLIATLSTKTNESRLFPVWFQDSDGWLLFPLAYYFSDAHRCAQGCAPFDCVSMGSPFLFNYIKGGDNSFVQSLLYFSSLSPEKTHVGVVPFFSYYSEKDKEDYSLWTPLYRRGVETNVRSSVSTSEVTTTRDAWARNSFFSLYGSTHHQRWVGTKEHPRATLTDDESRAWTFPFYWNWENHLTGKRSDLLLPFCFRTIDGRDAPGTWATPLFGWGADKSWWYALNVGRYHSARWCLPFAYWNFKTASDGSAQRNLWTALGYLNTTRLAVGETKVRSWGVGPLLPILANGDEREINLLGGLLWSHRDTPLNRPNMKYSRDTAERCAICGPRNTDKRYEASRSNLLLGALYGHKLHREYETASLFEHRPIYVEKQEHDIGLLLWQQSTSTLYGAESLPEGAIYPAKTGYDYSLLGGLWSSEDYRWQCVERYSRAESCRAARHSPAYDYRRLKSEKRTTEHNYGWILWKDEAVAERDGAQNQRLATAFRTPLFGWGSTHYRTASGETFDGGDRFSLLLGLYNSETAICYGDYDNLNPMQCETQTIDQEKRLLWSMLWDWEHETEIALSPNAGYKDLNPETPECERRISGESHAFLRLLWNCSDTNYSHVRHGQSTTRYVDRALLLGGLLYRDESCIRHEFSYCTEPKCREEDRYCSNVLRREVTTTYEQFSLLGLLTYRDFEDTLVYERGDPETLKVDLYKDNFRVLLGIPYKRSRMRDGTIKRSSLFGLLFDQEVAPAKQTSTLGLLGFLYRHNRHADGTREQLIFPFIRTTANDSSETWSASILGNFLKVERLPNGETDWTLLWL